MDVDVEGIIRCIMRGDETGVQTQLQDFNKEYAQCFFFDTQERDRRKQRELEEFRQNKVRDYVDSDSECEFSQEDRGLVLRQNLAAVLVRFIRTDAKSRLLRVCLRSLRILSRDKQALGPLVTDSALLTLARLAGLTRGDTTEEDNDLDSDLYEDIIASLAEVKATRDGDDEEEGDVDGSDLDGEGSVTDTDAKSDVSNDEEHDRRRRSSVNREEVHSRALERGRKDRRDSKMDGEEEEEEEVGEEAQRKEAMKVLCNLVYNSTLAQERLSVLRLLCGLIERLSNSANRSSPPPSGQFYELRLMFLMTALRPELRLQLQQEGGVSILTEILEHCLEVQWRDQYEVVLDPTAPPISLEASQRAVEILKVLFNITYSTHRQEPEEDDAALYRHLVAILRLCLVRSCMLTDDTDELQGHTVNLLSALPLQCLDVLLSLPVAPGSQQTLPVAPGSQQTLPVAPGSQQTLRVNMDCVHTLLLFMERRLEDSGDKMKERLTPILNLLTESCRAHRETRHYIRKHILPPLRDLSHRPEEGSSMKSRLVRLMTHLDTDLKHCAADLLFVLCKENVRRFVKYTGYGNAAGLLATRGLLGGQSSRGSSSGTQYSSDSDSDTEEYRQVKGRVNPVTGRVEEVQPDPLQGMTEEEKEQEARRLVMLFNKLSRGNIIQPMRVDSEGRLVMMTGLRGTSLVEEEEEESVLRGNPDPEEELD
ncbi:chaperone Ric-8A [Polymixia lowei]